MVTLPHVATSSLAMSLLSDLLPRLSHSSPGIRKKTVIAVYRLALVYPEALRPAWPQIKDLLMNEEEDTSVTAAVVNVVCELGWRRPRDFLPLAPRLFALLVEGGNNWMAIKIIKLVGKPLHMPWSKLSVGEVCDPNPPGASLGQKAAPSSSHTDPYDPGNVTPLRMYQRHCSRRHIRGY